MYYELITLGLVCMLAPWVARLAGYETSHKPFDFVGMAGIFFLLGAAFGLATGLTTFLTLSFAKGLLTISFVLGLISLCIGALWGMFEVIREPGHGLLHKTTL